MQQYVDPHDTSWRARNNIEAEAEMAKYRKNPNVSEEGVFKGFGQSTSKEAESNEAESNEAESNETVGINNVVWTVGQEVEWKDADTEEWKDGKVVSVDDGAGLICVEVDGDTMFIDAEDAPEELRVKPGTYIVPCKDESNEPRKREMHRRADGSIFYTFEGEEEPEITGMEKQQGKDWVKEWSAGEWQELSMKRTTYQVVKGDGTGKPVQKGYTITLHAKAYLKASGKCFWDTRELGHIFEFKHGDDNVISGFNDGIAGMKGGEIRKLDIPSFAAYGTKGYAPWDVPAGADLLFEIEILFVRRGFA